MTPSAHDTPPGSAWAPPAGRPPLSARLMRSTWRGLPPRRHAAGLEPGLVVPAADGSPLVTDHYFPRAEGEFPTLLVRSPYGRGLPWGPQYGMLFAEQGFHVILQSCRGTGGSGGLFDLWRNEAADGLATVAWLREQPWFEGALGTVGPSYLGYAQWALALEPPPELKAMVVQLGLHDPWALFHAGGVLHLENALLVAAGMTHQHRGVLALVKASARVRRVLRGPTAAAPPQGSYAAALGGEPPWLDGVIAHGDPEDPYWRGASTARAAEGPGVPTALITGWHDVLAGQTFEQYARLRRAGRESSLLVGPWTHASALRQGWPEVFAESLAWLRAHLCSDPSGLRPTPVRVHVGGEDVWRDLDAWPQSPETTSWFPAPDGHLIRQAPAGSAPLASFRHDPADPTPSVGGPLLSLGAGPRDNTALEAREDVLTFTGPPLTEPVEIAGPVLARLSVSTDGAPGVVFARLCDVDPRGRSTHVCDGPAPLPAGGPSPARITAAMGATAYRFATGHRIRWQLSAGAHPRFAPEPGAGDAAAGGGPAGPVRVTVHSDSALLLPHGLPGPVVDDTPRGAVGWGSPTRGGAAR
ncbi:CocE/NonD family hydrolase [Streptomyces sp. NPDC006512]|uniref:CocE/NonD family hydrolase n=1 Tax=Streptomyces sp. NPDC006512 TaxID=3154307 RepID=UPI0033A8FA6E